LPARRTAKAPPLAFVVVLPLFPPHERGFMDVDRWREDIVTGLKLGVVHIFACRQEGAMNHAPTDRRCHNPCWVYPRCWRRGVIHRALLPMYHARVYS